MTPINSSQSTKILPDIYPLIDTHTHFDASVFDNDKALLAQQAYAQGVHHLVLVGYLHQYFDRMYETEQLLKKPSQISTQVSTIVSNNQNNKSCTSIHIALGLHPFYIEQHTADHLKDMTTMIAERRPLAIGEIGLDTFTDTMKAPDMFAKQVQFFMAQLDLAVTHQLPVLLHIRKAHAEALAILKAHDYDAHKLGGIAHSFSGGTQEAKAFVKLGFKLGVTGQVTNPNAKKLRRAIQAAVASHGIECLVIETDCPDMTPIMCQTANDTSVPNRNVPANLPWVLLSLSELLDVSPVILAKQLWHNSCRALRQTWPYPK
ncbi:TatD family hydrolase [Psychrobacter aquaticus]|uniref:Putative deoxyribonuclease YjjV n=1 Tax=Psychrobacter aquaticus CMS 56 TaxID=1354303 RepID=U4T9C9_9GAMM|nr:TatD family hydrolase [Psychrobacter aquaticus]ERL56731.1 putative deoxyribonuclease YjjV [Psychrobacter aquaticus CMS 56]